MIQKLPLTYRSLDNAYMEWGKTIFVVLALIFHFNDYKPEQKMNLKNLVKSHSTFIGGGFKNRVGSRRCLVPNQQVSFA